MMTSRRRRSVLSLLVQESPGVFKLSNRRMANVFVAPANLVIFIYNFLHHVDIIGFRFGQLGNVTLNPIATAACCLQ